jgi:pimeloyl-ACP methyl ester carboxylesterase
MRFVFLFGGSLGFAVAALTGWLADRSADRIVLDGAVGCLIGALLFRWFWTVLLRGLRETILIRQKAAVVAASTGKQP